MLPTLSEFLTYSDEVATAPANEQPVVALESTIISHGMPYPTNRDTALLVENVIREQGAIPATIAVLEGKVCIGLTTVQIEQLAQTENAMKLSRADLAVAVARKVPGSTTVAATMIAAAMAKIEVFATGGIGGVHQGADTTFDISADLQELARTPVTVVSAGPKAILDLPKTLEYLETQGVPVVAYQQDAMPAFWSQDSGLAAPLRIDDLNELAKIIRTRQALGMHGGLLVGNPVPKDAEIPRAQMQLYIDTALREAQTKGVRGKAVTPWLLERIVELSDGRSLQTNQKLIVNNAQVAANLACALHPKQ